MTSENHKVEASISQEELSKVSKSNSRVDISLNSKVLATYPLFQGVTPESINSLLEQCEIRVLSAGEILLTPGEENHYLYLLISGHLQAYIANPNKTTINKQAGFTIFPGESIGEMSIIENKPVSAQVVAQEDCSILVIHERVFWEKLVTIPSIVKNLLQGLSNRMRQRDELSLKNLEQQLKFEYLQKDLAAANKIQSNILPKDNPLFPDYPQVDVFALIIPAREVGGDFFDAIPLDENHICIAIGDVSGKGIPAALFMIRVITLLRLSISRINPLGAIIESINHHLCEGNDDCMFVTMFVGILNVTSGQLLYVNGGHNLPFLSSKNRSFELLEVPTGMLLGIAEEAKYKVAELVLQPGDTLVLYTDGVTEAENGEDLFSGERTCQVLNTIEEGAISREIATTLQASVFNFSASVPQSDDITILVLRYLQ